MGKVASSMLLVTKTNLSLNTSSLNDAMISGKLLKSFNRKWLFSFLESLLNFKSNYTELVLNFTDDFTLRKTFILIANMKSKRMACIFESNLTQTVYWPNFYRVIRCQVGFFWNLVSSVNWSGLDEEILLSSFSVELGNYETRFFCFC